MNSPGRDNDYLLPHARLLYASFAKLTGKEMIVDTGSGIEMARSLWRAPFGLVSHGVEENPVFNYANQTALRLFEMKWEEFTCLPSRNSAEPVNREQRQRLLDQVSSKGFIDNYQGVRISSGGRRFRIENAIVWNLVDDQGVYRGQAACFHRWMML